MAYRDVVNFHEKFGVPTRSKPGFLDKEAFDYRVKFLKEELQEFIDSHNDGDLETAFDSLIDIVYVAFGTAHMMGVSTEMWREMFAEVQRANMTKVRATSSEQSTRGTSLDVIKPDGWTGPNHTPIIEKYSK